jgi:RHS repeat-associated protein
MKQFALNGQSGINGRTSRNALHVLGFLRKERGPLTVLASALVCLGVIGSAHTVQAASAPPMSLPGAFEVNATGGADYSIPIAVPPGTAGMQPSLALTYSSQNDDGILGWGWSLSGLPSIARCPATFAQDGQPGGVNFGSNDKFCLDGQRLMAKSPSDCPGAEVGEFRTEIDSFSRICSYGSTGNGPTYFKVWTKDGQILELGNTSDSRAVTNAITPTSVRVWAVNKVSDKRGNYFTVTYNDGTADTTNGQIYPTRIDYTGNAGASLPPYNSVRLTYDSSRGDVTPTYQAGSLLKTTKRLTNVKTYVGASTLVSNYVIHYDTNSGTSTRRSRIDSIKRCDNDAGTSCLAPTEFTWQGTSDTLSTSTSTSITIPFSWDVRDWNADGLNDSLHVVDMWFTPAEVWLGTQDSPSSYTYEEWGFTWNTWGQYPTEIFTPLAIVVDHDGDGWTDVEVWQPWDATTSYALFRNDRQGAFVEGSWLAMYWGAVGDFTGDGRTDSYFQGTGRFSLGGTYGYAYTWFPDYDWSPGDETIFYPADFNGDGCADLLGQGTTFHKIAYSQACAPAVTSVNVTNWDGYDLVLGDYNGDGKADILALNGTTSNALYLSTGIGLTTAYTVPSTWGAGAARAGDYNRDGKTDIAIVPSSGNATIYLSTGSGFTASPTSFSIGSGPLVSYEGDYNNDGATDIYLTDTQSPFTTRFWTTAFVPEVIIAIRDGLGTSGLEARTTISYDRLNKNGTFYTKDSDATYPVMDTVGPLFAVKQVVTTNGVGGAYTRDYSYVGAKTHQHGRGFLGLRQRKVSDPQTGILTTTTYDQDFPYIGLVDQETRVRGSVTLSDVTNSYCETNCTTSSGVYFPYLVQSILTTKDLDGTSLPTVTTTYGVQGSSSGYDAYGNVTKVTVETCSYTGSSCTDEVSTKVTDNTYWAADTSNWIVAKLKTASTVASLTGASNLTRSSSFDYDYDTGLITYERIEPDDTTGALKQVTQYTYDGWGNRSVIALSGNVGNARTTNIDYEKDKKRFPATVTKVTSPTNETETWTYDERFGTPASQTDPNLITTAWSYDSFGRKLYEARFVGLENDVFTDFVYQYCSGVNGGTQTCPANAAFVVTATPKFGTAPTGSQNGPQSKIYFDRLSRVVAEEAQGFYTQTYNSCWIRTSTEYDSKGRVSRVSRPHFTGGSGCPTDSIKWVTNTSIDDLARVTLATNPNGGTVATTYAGLSTTVTVSVDANSANNQATTTVKNVLGLVKQVTDANNKTTTHSYSPFGDLVKITDSLPTPNVTRYSYDKRGRKIFACEPDKVGAIDADSCDDTNAANTRWKFKYNTFGDLIEIEDAKGQTTTADYDELGRPEWRAEPGLYSTWTMGDSSASKNIGKIVEAEACTSSTQCTGTDLKARRDFTYETTYGHPASVALTVNGASQGTYATTYTNDHRINTVTYPSAFVVQYSYTGLGFVYSLKESGATYPFWNADSRNADQNITAEYTSKPSSGATAISTSRIFDPNTGLMSDLVASGSAGTITNPLTWTATATPCTANCWGSKNWGGSSVMLADFSYTYDYLGKMMRRENAAPQTPTLENFCYDKLNRLTDYAPTTTCTGTGTVNVAYNETGNITSKTGVGSYYYTGSNCTAGTAGPHAVCRVLGTLNGLSDPTFTYDNNGNMTLGAGRSVVYSSFNMSAEMSQGTTRLCWDYDAGHARVRMREYSNSESSCAASPVSTTYYLNDSVSGLMSEKIVSGANTTTKDYLMVAGVMVGTRTKLNAGSPTIAYYVVDHLGSIAVTTSDAGVLDCRITYDPWGKSTPTCSTPPTRGFTSEESINSGALVNLVNLNARVYDPVLARFMAADPISDPYAPQSLNLYTYALNSPVTLTDRTGLASGCISNAFGGMSCFQIPTCTSIACGRLDTSWLPAGYNHPPIMVFAWDGEEGTLRTQFDLPNGNGAGAGKMALGGKPGTVPRPRNPATAGSHQVFAVARNSDASETEAGAYGAGDFAVDAIDFGTDFVPILSDIKAIGEAIANPTPVNILAAGVGLVPGPGDVAAKALKTGEKVVERAAKGYTSKIDRAAFKKEREAFWKKEAQANPGKYSPADLARMRQGGAPTGPDGRSMELHHRDGSQQGPLDPMSASDHRGGENYKKNHPWLGS